MGYWQLVHRQAWKRTVTAVAARPLRLVVFLVAQTVAAAAIWLTLVRFDLPASDFTWRNIGADIIRLVVAAIPFLAFPLLYAWRLLRAPAWLHRQMEAQQWEDLARIEVLEAEIARLKAEPPPASRDPDGIFQHGVQVGRVVLALTDPARGSATFQQIVEAADFDTSAEFDYRDWVLRLQGVGGDMRSQIGGTRSRTLSQVVCRIERQRAWRES